MQLIIGTLAVFSITMVDFVLVMAMIFTQVNQSKYRYLYYGSLIGMLIILLTSTGLSEFIKLLPEQWMIGLIGLIPLFDGIKTMMDNERHHPTDALKRIRQSKGVKLIGSMSLITLVTGGDNVGVYVTLFVNKTFQQLLIIWTLMLLLTLLAVWLGNYISNNHQIHAFIIKHEKWLMPVALIMLGIYILYDNGVFAQAMMRFTGK